MKTLSPLSFLALSIAAFCGVIATPLDHADTPSLKLVTREGLVEREDCYGPELPESTPIDGVLGGTTDSGSALEKRDNYNGTMAVAIAHKRFDP
ncbi:hypothetical protein TruAng_002498 [Truncatella angustata]|nr:hypothetical protein TruAng_002498 [Truncatella angustata]